MKIKSDLRGDARILRVIGKIVGPQIVDLCKQLEQFKGDGCGEVIVDLSEVDEVDSCGLGGLLYSHRILEKNGLTLVLACAQSHIRSLFADCNFDHAVRVIDSY
jgi:anti-anti-sigma factor